MEGARKRKHSSVFSFENLSSAVVTKKPKRRRKCTVSTKNGKKDTSVHDPSTNREVRPPNVSTSIEYECPICMDSTRKNEMKSLPCYHAFHEACIDKWLKDNRRCPICREEIAPQNIAPPLNNQRQSILDLPFRRNNSGIDMRFDSGSVIMNNGASVRNNNRGFVFRSSSGSVISSTFSSMFMNNGGSITVNNGGGFEMRLNGGVMILNDGEIRINSINV